MVFRSISRLQQTVQSLSGWKPPGSLAPALPWLIKLSHTTYPETCLSGETHGAGNCGCTRRSRRSLVRCVTMTGSLSDFPASSASNRAQFAGISVFSLLFYGTERQIVIGPPHREKLLSAWKRKAALKRVSDRVQTYISAHQCPSCRFEGCLAGSPVKYMRP